MSDDFDDNETDDPVDLSSPDPEEEARAIATGWTPLESFKGDPDRWTDAEAWNRRADEMMPILKSNNKKLIADLGATKAELSELKKTLNQIVRANEKVSEREYQRARETIKKEQAAAIENQDSERWLELETQKEKLEKPDVITQPSDSASSPDFEKNERIFYSRNSGWYNVDPEMTEYAQKVGVMLGNKGVPLADQFQQIEEIVMKKFPQGSNGKPKMTADRSTNAPAKTTGKKGVASLPVDAKKAYELTLSGIKNTAGFDEKKFTQQWLNDYYEE